MTTTSSTLAEQSAAIAEASAERLPADVLAAFGAERAKSIAGGVPAGVAGVGTVIPDADLLDAHDAPIRLTQARGDRPAVLVFYRGAWCPYCNLTLRIYQAQLVSELDAEGVALIAISPQKPDGSLSMQETNELTYRVLSDPGSQIAGQIGILITPSPDVLAAQGRLGVDLATINADGTPSIPLPTVVVLDGEGTIRWIDVRPDYTTRTEPTEILAAVQSTVGGAAQEQRRARP